jgi:DNA polymerase III alpha subunit
MSIPYVGLHRHTTYSLLDGYGRTEQITRRLQELGQPACAITDHGSVFGHIDFYHAMTRAGMKPILGCEFYHCKNMHLHGQVSSNKQEQAARQQAGPPDGPCPQPDRLQESAEDVPPLL